MGDAVNLQLMCRPKSSLKVFKMSGVPRVFDGNDDFPHLFGDSDAQMYSKLILADPNEVGFIFFYFLN